MKPQRKDRGLRRGTQRKPKSGHYQFEKRQETILRCARMHIDRGHCAMFPFVYEINFAGWFHLVFFGLLIPAGAFIQWRKFGKPDTFLPNRLLHFQSTALTIVMLGALSLMVARWEGLQLFPRVLPSWRAIGAGVLMFIGALAYMRPRWRRAVERRARVV